MFEGYKCGNSCSVVGCKNYSNQKNSQSLFRFPTELERCKLWAEACRNKELSRLINEKGPESLRARRICAVHFEEKHFRNPRLHSQGLLRTAVPTLLIAHRVATIKCIPSERLMMHSFEPRPDEHPLVLAEPSQHHQPLILPTMSTQHKQPLLPYPKSNQLLIPCPKPTQHNQTFISSSKPTQFLIPCPKPIQHNMPLISCHKPTQYKQLLIPCPIPIQHNLPLKSFLKPTQPKQLRIPCPKPIQHNQPLTPFPKPIQHNQTLTPCPKPIQQEQRIEAINEGTTHKVVLNSTTATSRTQSRSPATSQTSRVIPCNKCSVRDCYSFVHTRRKDAKSFFSFPKDPELCHKWIQACQRTDLEDLWQKKGSGFGSAWRKVCSSHFEAKWFKNPNNPNEGLLPDALPTVSLGSPDPTPQRLPTMPPPEVPPPHAADPHRNTTPQVEANTAVPTSLATRFVSWPSARRRCAVQDCEVYTRHIPAETTSFFRFPREPDKCKIWVQACGNQEVDRQFEEKGAKFLHDRRRVCSAHFKERSLRNPKNHSQGLYPDAVPVLFLGTRGEAQSSPEEQPQESLARKRQRECSPQPGLNEPVLKASQQNLGPQASDQKQDSLNLLAEQIKFQIQADKVELLKTKLRASQKCVTILRTTVARMQKAKAKRVKAMRAEKTRPPLASQCRSLSDLLANPKDTNYQLVIAHLKYRQRKKMGCRFAVEEKTFALALHHCSPKGYQFMQAAFCLPGHRSLHKWYSQGVATADTAAGVNQFVMKMLKTKAQVLDQADKLVTVVFDEMELKEKDKATAVAPADSSTEDNLDCVLQSASLAGEEGEEPSPAETSPGASSRGVVFMIRGIKLQFEQVVGYYVTKGAASASQLRDMLLEVLAKVSEAGFIPKAVVCDQGAGHGDLMSKLGATVDKPVYCLPDGDDVFFFYDAARLLCAVRHNLKRHDLRHGDAVYSWKHLEDFFRSDASKKIRLVPKLSEQHLEAFPFEPMSVHLASELFSRSVAAGLTTHVALKSLPQAASHTAEFVSRMDMLFDYFNSSEAGTKPINRPISCAPKKCAFLVKMRNVLANVCVANTAAVALSPPCFEGWASNISALRLLCEDLDQKYGVKSLSTRRLTLEHLEKVISALKCKGGPKRVPRVSAFQSAVRSAMTTHLHCPASSGRAELDVDLDTFLDKYKSLNQEAA